MASPTLPFTAHRLNPTTFRITENSPFSRTEAEKPQIYLKFYDEIIVVIDTGSARKPDNPNMALREFIETVPIAENEGRPLNEGKKLEYVVVLTHCHFDRIGGVSSFPTSTVGASSASRAFFAPSTLAANSLCTLVNIPPPAYVPTIFLEDEDTFPHVSIHESALTILHTPGHTPDSLCIYDPGERVLFAGDTLYENTAITFPMQGNVKLYLQSLDKLLSLVDSEGEGVKIAGGRGVWDADAGVLVKEAKRLIERALSGEVEVQEKGESRGNKLVEYGEGKIAFFGPESIFEDGRKATGAPTRVKL